MFDRIRKIATSAALRALTPNSVPMAYRSDSDDIVFKDEGGTVRAILHDPVAPTVYSVDGAVSIARQVGKITKAGVCALTLAAPTAAQEGTRITLISNTANAHTLTATGLIDDGITGGSKNLATFAAFAGASITLVAINLKWSVESKNVVTIS